MKKAKTIISALLSLVFAAGAAVPAFAYEPFTGFVENIQGIQYLRDGKPVEYEWITVDGKKYYAGGEGFICRGKCPIDGYLYSFDKDGVWDGTREKMNVTKTVGDVITAKPEELVCLSTVCYDKKLGAKLIETTNGDILKSFWQKLSGLELSSKTADKLTTYFDAAGVSSESPMQYVSITMNDGKELTLLFGRDAADKKNIAFSLHSADQAGKEFFEYKWDGGFYCDYSDFLSYAAKLFAPLPDASSQKSAGGKTVTGTLSDGKKIPAGIPVEISPVFRTANYGKPVYMNEVWRLEKYSEKDRKWKKVKPIGALAFTESEKEYRLTKIMSQEIPLSCFAPLGEGKYRIVKPYKKQGSNTVKEAYCEFSAVKSSGKKWKCAAKVVFSRDVYPTYDAGSGVIPVGLSYDDPDFAVCKVFDVQRKTDGKWKSVRTAEIKGIGVKEHYLYAAPDIADINSRDYDLTREGEYRAVLTVNRLQDGVIKRTGDYDVIYGYFRLEKQEISGVSTAITTDDISEMTKTVSVLVQNNGKQDITVKKAVITDGSGKTFECSTSYGYVGINRENTVGVTPAKPLSPGNYTLTLTVGAQACEEKKIKMKFKVRAATTEEKNSGVFFELERSSYSPTPEKVRVKITNRSPEKEDIIPAFALIAKGEKSTGFIYIGDYIGDRSKTVKYGKSEWITLSNIADGTFEEYIGYLAGSLGMGKDKLLEISEKDDSMKKQFEELKADPVSSLTEKGTYTVMILAMSGKTGETYEEELTLEVK